MITDIKIERFRGIKEGELNNITPLTVLVGPNGSGKSSLLEAMLIGASQNPIKQIKVLLDSRKPFSNPHLWLFWKRGLEQDTCSITTTFDNLVERKDTLRLPIAEQTLEYYIAHQEPSELPGASSTPLSDKGRVSFGEGLDITETIYNLTVKGYQQQLARTHGIQSVNLINASINAENSIEQLHSAIRDIGYNKILNEIVREVVPSLETIELLIDGLRISYPDRSVPVVYSGDGVYTLIRFIMELALVKDGVVLVEEPETHQHYRTINLSAKAIWGAVKRGIQVILTTHSLELIDALIETRPDDVPETDFSLFRTTLRDGILITQCHSGAEVVYARQEMEADLR